MVLHDEDCANVLIQLSAVISALKNTEKVILKEHIDHCIIEAVQEQDEKTIQALKEAIDRML